MQRARGCAVPDTEDQSNWIRMLIAAPLWRALRALIVTAFTPLSHS